MENKFVEFIENNKKVIISSVAVGVVLVLGFGWYSYNQQQAEQQAKIVQLEKDSKSDKEQVDKLFESFDASSDESISKLKELSETSLKTDAGKDYLNNKVKESSKAIVDFHLQKGLAYDVKDSDDKFKDKTTLETNVKEITKQIDFIKKVDETFKQKKLDETVKSLTDIADKFQKQIDVLKKEEEQKASDKAKEDKKTRRKKNLLHLNLLIVYLNQVALVHLQVIHILLQNKHILQIIVDLIQVQLVETIVTIKHQLLQTTEEMMAIFLGT